MEASTESEWVARCLETLGHGRREVTERTLMNEGGRRGADTTNEWCSGHAASEKDFT
jgi:hypothetical protein